MLVSKILIGGIVTALILCLAEFAYGGDCRQAASTKPAEDVCFGLRSISGS